MLQERHRIRNISDTQFTWFLTPSATEWAREWVSEKISIPGNNMIHCTVIRDSARWKEKIRSLTWVTHRETQILSKCHQAHCSCRALCENVQSEFIIFIYFHLAAIITLSKDCDAQKKRNWKAKVKSRSRAKRSIFYFFIFFPPFPHGGNALRNKTQSSIHLFEQIFLMIESDNLFITYDEAADWKLSAALSLFLGLGGWSYQSTDQ